MDKKKLFEYLRDNLSIRSKTLYGYQETKSVEISLCLIDPETGKQEVISSEYISIDLK